MEAQWVDLIIESTGLPKDFARSRLETLLHQAGFDPDHATLEQIREVLADLLQDLILAADAAN